MKVILIYPDFGDKKVFHPPIGVAGLGTILLNEGHKIKIIVGCFEKGIKSAFDKIKKFSPDIVAVSSLSYTFPKAQAILKLSKSAGFITILGGIHSTVFSEESMEFADFVVLGEGEETIKNLVNALDKGVSPKNIKGICYKDKGSIKCNPRPEPLDIDSIPIPKRELLPMSKYLKYAPSSCFFFSLPRPSTTISVIRGCPFNCIYCQPTQRITWGSKIRARNPKLVVDEMEYLKKRFKLKAIVEIDDLFTFDEKWASDVCKEIIRRKLNIMWECNGRVNRLSEKLLRLMKKAGCVRIRFGVESGSQKILNNLRKGAAVKQILDAFKMCDKYGMLTHAYFMFGSPGETHETIAESFKLLKQIKPDMVQLSIVTPLPGTDLYDQNVNGNKEKINFDYTNTSKSRIKTDVPDKDLDKYIRKFRFRALWYAFLKFPVKIVRNPRNVKLFMYRVRYALNYGFLRDGIRWLLNKN